MANSKTKVVVALGALDLARQVAKAWSAKHEAERERVDFGVGLREDLATLARDARTRVADRLPDHFEWGLPPWRREPTLGERLAKWAPTFVVALVSALTLVFVARRVAHHQEDADAEELATDRRVVGAIAAGSKAIDAGVTKVVEGGTAAATGTAAAVAAGSTAVKAAAVDRAKVELDERVVAPAKAKAIRIGTVAFLGLTAYVVVLAACVQLVVDAAV